MPLKNVLSKQIKIRNDSIEEFTKANRLDLVELNKKEILLELAQKEKDSEVLYIGTTDRMEKDM